MKDDWRVEKSVANIKKVASDDGDVLCRGALNKRQKIQFFDVFGCRGCTFEFI